MAFLVYPDVAKLFASFIQSFLSFLYFYLGGQSKNKELLPPVPKWVTAPATKEQLEYADLPIVDFSKAKSPEGRAELTDQVRKAMTTSGFFYVVNHGYTQEQRDRIFDIADLTFSGVSMDEKKKYTSTEATRYKGYKPLKYWRIEPGVYDSIEHYNIHRDVYKNEHPKALRPFLPEIEAFALHNHFSILRPILRILARGLELPEDTLLKMHGFEDEGETSIRFMKYYNRTPEEEEKTKNVWLKGHTDIGGVTILWSQPTAALQILSPDGKWRWIKHIDNALVINIGDALEFLSGGYYKATIHRVIQPPRDQRTHDRVGVFCFAMPSDKVKLAPLSDSPVLQSLGMDKLKNRQEAPTMEEWRQERTKSYGQVDLKMGQDGHEEETVKGIVVKHYN